MIFEEREDLELCGVLKRDGEMLGLFFRPETGDVIYYDQTNHQVLTIGEFGSNAVTKFNEVEDIVSGLEDYPNAVGILYTEDYVHVIVSETRMEIYALGETETPAEVMEILLDCDDTVEDLDEIN